MNLERLKKLAADIPPSPYSSLGMRRESFGDGQECENARLQPLIALLIKIVEKQDAALEYAAEIEYSNYEFTEIKHTSAELTRAEVARMIGEMK